MNDITTPVASFRTSSHLDTRRTGRYQQLDVQHARLRRQKELTADRAKLAADVTQKRMPPRPPQA